MHITIIGLGETGVTIGALLNQQVKNSYVHVLDTDEQVQGRFLDLQHAAAYANNVISLNDFKNVGLSDYVFYCAGFRNTKLDDRLSVAKKNKALINTIFTQFKLKKTCKIIVLTNPVELITEWLSEYFDHELTVVGTGTDLDTYRFKFLISDHLGFQPKHIAINVVGEHGEDMVTHLSQGKINEKPVEHFLSTEEIEKLIQELKNSATTIRKTEEATKFGVAQCAVAIMKSFESETPQSHVLSLAMNDNWKKELGLKEDIFFSQPCSVSYRGVKIDDSFSFTHLEKKQLVHASQKIAKADQENR